MKLIPNSTSATLRITSLFSNAVSAAGAWQFAVPATMPAILGLAANGAVKLRQEKAALISARRMWTRQGSAFVYGTPVMVTEHQAGLGCLVGDEQTPSTANGGVQGSPPWRRPVIT